MRILVTNDDGYNAKGIRTLVNILRPYGKITVVAPKKMQSGMSMAVNLGQGPIATKKIKIEDGVEWWYLDGTPSSCVKLGIDNIFYPEKPDVVVSGINHGGNFGTAYLYSGTIGAASEAALAYIPAIAVSQDSFDPDADFSAVQAMLPEIMRKVLDDWPENRPGLVYNINFPAVPLEDIKGVKYARQGFGHWEKEFEAWDEGSLGALNDSFLWQHYRVNLEDGEKAVFMRGTFINDDNDADTADHLLLEQGWVTIAPINIFMTDMEEYRRRTK